MCHNKQFIGFIVLSIVSIITITCAYSVSSAEKRAYVYTGFSTDADTASMDFQGDYFTVIDTQEDKIINRFDFTEREDIHTLYAIMAFTSANAIIAMDEYRVIALDADTLELRKKFDIYSHWDWMNLLLGPKGDNMYVGWLPYENLGDEDMRKMTIIDNNLQTETINGVFLSDAQGFSDDGSKLFVYDSVEETLHIINVVDNKYLKAVPRSELGGGDAGVRFVLDIENRTALVLGKRKVGDEVILSAFGIDLVTNEAKPIINDFIFNSECKLYSRGTMAVCDEVVDQPGGPRVKQGKLYFYDVISGEKVASIYLNEFMDFSGIGGETSIIGITPDNNKLYYLTAKGLKVISLDSFSVMKTVDFPYGYAIMTFYGYE